MKTAPIALFVNNRPDHTRRTVEALQKNNWAAESDLFIFSDGAPTSEAAASVQKVRKYLASIEGFKSVHTVARERNFGLANSIVDGVTKVCGEYGRVVVLEDDLVTSPHFLRFMNEALDAYENEERVASVHGYWYPVDGPVPETFFLRIASSWGWATWSRAWRLFERDGGRLLAELRRRKLENDFDLEGAVGYTRMLKEQIAGKNDSWAIRWDASLFLSGRMSLYPGASLVRNIGFDGTGTHSSATAEFEVEPARDPIRVSRVPVEESAQARAALIRYYRSRKRNIFGRLAGRLGRLVQS
jgi:hypothetical protein